MKLKSPVVILFIVGLFTTLGIGGYKLYTIGLQRGIGMRTTLTPVASAVAPVGKLPQSIAEGEAATRRHIQLGVKAGDIDPNNGSMVLYYHDPMMPGNKFDQPAKSPFMDMMLVPVYADGDSDASQVTVSPRVQQNLGVRTAEVTLGMLSPQVLTVGSIAFNERDQVVVQARATGYVEHLYVRATLDKVFQGQPLVDLYVPDWIAAQEEFLSVRRMQGSNLASLVDGARQRMRQVGMNDAQIRLVEHTGRTQPRITLTAPINGVIVELLVRDGMTMMPGATLFRINGLSTVWANAEVPESQAAFLHLGIQAHAKSPAAPGVTFSGVLQTILPEVNSVTRTMRARLELTNSDGRLVPGMFVQVQFKGIQGEKSLLIPTEAVIQTGTRAVVMLAETNGNFRPMEVEIGVESVGKTEIKRGLKLGQRVVVSSQFLIDSEASLKGVEAQLSEAPKSSASQSARRHDGQAKVQGIGPNAMVLSHNPITSLNWPEMTMEFKLPTGDSSPSVKIGDGVNFEFYIDSEGLPQLTKITLQPPEPKSDSLPLSKTNKP